MQPAPSFLIEVRSLRDGQKGASSTNAGSVNRYERDAESNTCSGGGIVWRGIKIMAVVSPAVQGDNQWTMARRCGWIWDRVYARHRGIVR